MSKDRDEEIAILERDLMNAQRALRRIMGIDTTQGINGPKKEFGKKFIIAFAKAKTIATETYYDQEKIITRER